MAIVNEIVVAFILHQLIRVLTYAVLVEVITIRSVPNNHLTIGIERIQAGRNSCAIRKRLTLHKAITQIQRNILRQLMAIVNEIVVAFILHQLIGVQAGTIDIEVIADRTVQFNKLKRIRYIFVDSPAVSIAPFGNDHLDLRMRKCIIADMCNTFRNAYSQFASHIPEGNGADSCNMLRQLNCVKTGILKCINTNGFQFAVSGKFNLCSR